MAPEVKVGVKDSNTNEGEIEHVDNGKKIEPNQRPLWTSIKW